jgi:hypothetical protein
VLVASPTLRMTRDDLAKPAALPASVKRTGKRYFGQGGSPGLPHACGCPTGGWTRTAGGG